jgi:hypothetical protein
MSAATAGLAERVRQRSRPPDPALRPRRREIAAAAATAAVAGQLVLAPATLVLAAALVLAGLVARWRPHWLAMPALTGLALLASSPRSSLHGFLAPGRAFADDLAAGSTPSRILHRALIAAAAPGQLPLALLASTAEAGILLWAIMYRQGAPRMAARRPGAIALARGLAGRAALAAGRTVTQTGCAVGIEPATGRLATMRWADFEAGALARGPDPAAVIGLCLPVVAAALRRRMAVVVLDVTRGQELSQAVIRLGRPLGVRITCITLVRAATVARKLLGRQCSVARGGRADLAALAAGLRGLADMGIRADALLWVHGFGEAETEAATRLVPLGPSSGVRILLSTCDDAAAAGLDPIAGTTLTARPDGTGCIDIGQPGSGRAHVCYTVIPVRDTTTTCR